MRVAWYGYLVARGMIKKVLALGTAAALEAFAAGGALDKKLVTGFAGAVGVMIAGFTA